MKRWFSGVFLIALGLVFLLNNYGVNIPVPENWWAIFIVFASISSFTRAWSSYQTSGYNYETHRSLWAGATTALVGAVFILGADWDKVWPLFLVLTGVLVFTRPKRLDTQAAA